MKIAFVTGSLEPGKDGVGDYTRLLAEECVRQGHQCCLISLNDRFSTYSQQLELEVDGFTITMLRLPASTSWSNRITLAKNFLDLFEADWLSLQFVPYGFQSKGIVYRLSKWLSQLAKGRNVHIMFHELWIGESLQANLKERIVGKIQKFFILRLVRQLKPFVVHTSNSTYIAILKQHSILANRLPLFGNIPIANQNGDNWLFPEFKKIGVEIKTENRTQFWLFGFFGTLKPVWSSEPLFTYIQQAATRYNRKVAMVSIGRLGSGEKLWEHLSQRYGHQFTFLLLGEQSPKRISEFLNSIDFSIATSPYLLVNKSGTVAATLEHGVPVIVSRNDFQIAPHYKLIYEKEPCLYKMDCNLVNKLSNEISRITPQSRLATTATQFTNNLIESTSLNI